MARHGRNIHKRNDGRWEGRYICSRDANGKAKYRSVYGHSCSEVTLKLSECKKQNAMAKKPPVKISVADMMTQYINSVADKVKASTLYRYKFLTEKHILPIIGNLKVSGLTTKKLSDFLDGKRKNGRLDGKGGLSEKSVRDIAVLFKSALKFIEKKYQFTSAVIDISLPKRSPTKVDVFSEKEIAIITQQALIDNNVNGLGVILAANLGLRLGEICALRWSDIDMSEQTLTISRTVQRMTLDGRSQLVVGSPKSDASCHTIPVPDGVMILIRHFMPSLSSDSYILTGSIDKPLNPRTLQYRFESLLRRCGVRKRKFHALRHTFATRCIQQQKFDVKSISEMLGHSDISITLRLYVHPTMEHKKKVVNEVSTLKDIIFDKSA